MSHAADQPERTPERSPAQFTLVDLLLLVAATGPTLGLLGTLQTAAWTEERVFFLWVGSLVAWVVVYLRGRYVADRRFIRSGIAAAGLFIVACTTFQLVSCGREGPRRFSCTNNLKQITLALHTYHDVHHRFPPAYIADENGRPMHSWRVLILPFLEQNSLYDRYDFNEPWDGPNNRLLLAEMPDVYRCPHDTTSTPTTSYVAIVGPETAWPVATSVRLGGIRDGPGRTVLVVESHDAAIPWMQPADLESPVLVPRINRWPGPGISSAHPGGAQAAFADGHVEFLSDSLAPDEVRALLTISGGEPAVLE